MQVLPHTKSCFVCGEANSIGLHLKFETDGSTVHTRFSPRPEHVGFRQTVHGGITATLLDEIMVWACAVGSQRFAFCAELNVRFHEPVRPGREYLAVAELVSNRRNKLFDARAELRDTSGQVMASATGRYLAMKEGDTSEMSRDLIGDFTFFQGRPAIS